MTVFLVACDDDASPVTIDTNFVNGVDTSIISPAFNFESQFIDVLASEIHYVDEAGDGEETFLLLHGQPTNVYLWRNIIPHLKARGRVVAPDLIGMGQSGKPDLDYTFSDHINYINAFIERLDLKDITLVIHDWGSAIGFNYAANFSENVKGIVFMEALVAPSSINDIPPSFAQILQVSFNGIEGDTTSGTGWRFNAIDNQFIESIIPTSILRPLSEEEMDAYRAPFPTVADRKPVWQFPRQVPIFELGTAENIAIVSNYFDFLQNSNLPKLFLYAEPGVLMNAETGELLQSIFPNTTVKGIGPGLHFVQEDQPHTIGILINEWVDNTL